MGLIDDNELRTRSLEVPPSPLGLDEVSRNDHKRMKVK
jgi:hypothetical protein